MAQTKRNRLEGELQGLFRERATYEMGNISGMESGLKRELIDSCNECIAEVRVELLELRAIELSTLINFDLMEGATDESE